MADSRRAASSRATVDPAASRCVIRNSPAVSVSVSTVQSPPESGTPCSVNGIEPVFTRSGTACCAQRYIEPIARQAQAIASAILGDGTTRFAPQAVPLRVKTGSIPFTLHGVPDPGGLWTVDTDTDTAGELRMTQRDAAGSTVARLAAARRESATHRPRPPG